MTNMSNEEIAAKIERLQLEQKLTSLMPDTRSKGQKYIASVGEMLLDGAKEKGTKLLLEYGEKQIKDKLGLSDKKDSYSERLKKMAQDYTNRKIIDENQKRFKEGPYAERKSKKSDAGSTQKNSGTSQNKSDDSPWSGTVEGAGKSTYNPDRDRDAPYYEANYRDIDPDTVSRGASYVSQFLLEDKKR